MADKTKRLIIEIQDWDTKVKKMEEVILFTLAVGHDLLEAFRKRDPEFAKEFLKSRERKPGLYHPSDLYPCSIRLTDGAYADELKAKEKEEWLNEMRENGL